MNNMKLWPQRMIDEAVQLAPAIRANRNYKFSASDLFRKANCGCSVELLRPVDSETPTRPTQCMHEHRHLGRIGAEMGVQMTDGFAVQPIHNPTGFRQIDDVHWKRPIRTAAHREDKPEAHARI